MPYARNNIRVNVQNRSGFDKRHRNSGTFTCGTLTPILCDEVVPNTRVSLKLNLAAQLPPLASDTFMNLKLKAEAFFVPMRLLCGSFESFFCDFPRLAATYNGDDGNTILKEFPGCIPYIDVKNTLSSDEKAMLTAPGSLADYLGIRVSSVADWSAMNPLPFAAYHLVWQEWYRNPRVQKPAFVPYVTAQPLAASSASYYSRAAFALPYEFYSHTLSSSTSTVARDFISSFNLGDGTSLFSLRQRNFGLDYFTGARLSPQQGPAVSLNVPFVESDLVSVVDSEGNPANVVGEGARTGFTIAALRAANSLQQFRERNNLPSPRLVDQVKARYGANLSDGVAQRPICIGSASYDMDVNGISQTAPGSASDHNPFGGVANQYGRGFGSGSDFIISDFVASEPGYILVNLSLVPEVTYGAGINPIFTRYTAPGSITDMACSLLQNVGDQPIFAKELQSNPDFDPHVFGYTDRFADFMFVPNSAHGLFREGQSLASFVLQRTITTNDPAVYPTLSDSFLQIPKTFLDQIFAASSAITGVSGWYDCLLDYKVSMPLAEYSIPSLQDPAYEHGRPVVLRRNGQIF